MTKFKACSAAFPLFVLFACHGDGAKQDTHTNEGTALAQAQASASAAISEAAEALAAASAARVRTTADERMALAAMPENYLKTSNATPSQEEVARHHLQLSSLTVSNTSRFSVDDLRGEVAWVDARGASVGSSPFSLKGSLLAGETKTFSATEGTLASPGKVEGVATQSTIAFRRVTVLN
jgi:hypothetical protein